MPNARSHRYADAIERVWELDPDAARVIERHVADLRNECAQRRVEAKVHAARAGIARDRSNQPPLDYSKQPTGERP